jgi:hypothetical protein
LQPTTQARTAVGWLHVVFEYSVVDFIQFSLLKRSYHVSAFHLANVLVLGLSQALRLSVSKDFIQLLLASIATAVNACRFAEPIHRSLDACGGCDLLYCIA